MDMKTYLIFCVTFSLLPVSAPARELVGKQGNREIRLRTDLIEAGEYVQASELAAWFPDRFIYDALSGTLVFVRPDGVQVGMKTDDERVMVGGEIIHTGAPPIRRKARLYVPFYTVSTYLFPQIRFVEMTPLEAVTAGEVKPATAAAPTPSRYIFTYPTRPQTTPEKTPYPTLPGFVSTLVPTPLYPNPTPWVVEFGTPTPSPVSGVIILDPGHDPTQPGASTAKGTREAELTLSLCEKMEAALKQSRRFEVVLTRRRGDAQALDNEQRIGLANEHKGTLFVSVHCGALFNNTISRSAVFYMNPAADNLTPTLDPAGDSPPTGSISWHTAYKTHTEDSRRLAQAVIRQLQMLYSLTNIIQLDSDPIPGRFAVLRGLAMPGVVVELGNLIESKTAQYLETERTQREVADSLAVGITDCLYERAGMAEANRIRP